jgi:hypothetical protein
MYHSLDTIEVLVYNILRGSGALSDDENRLPRWRGGTRQVSSHALRAQVNRLFS